ncbi:MAG: potassium channel family protein [Victivallaceae bacterium]|nr:potassium channel family protein [Victivallaceae bacterium]
MLKQYFIKYEKFINGRNHLWITFGYLMFALMLTVAFIYFPDIRKTHPLFFTVMNIMMLFFPILIVITNIISFQQTLSSLKKLASLYLQVILMFGVIYYFGTASNAVTEYNRTHSPRFNRLKPAQDAISGIDTDWVKLAIDDSKNKQAIFTEALVSFQDCIHFSLITSTTVGYGDIVPKNPIAKLLVDIQVLISCFLLAFGVGSFFNSDKESMNKKLSQMGEELNQRLNNIEQKLDKK